PVFVETVAWIDALNRVWGANFTAPYAEVDVGKLTGEYRVELGAFYALYREALTSQSVFYQFLCFSKILEGAFRWMVPRFFERARAAGVTLERRTPKVPALDAIDTMPAIKRYEGQSIADVFTNFLEAEFRNAVAHFKADDEDPVQVSNYFASARIANVL